MKKLLAICLLLLLTLFSQAQTSVNNIPTLISGTITGTVIDETLQQPLPYVTIILKSESDETINGTITDDNGKFVLQKVPGGKYIVTIQFIGYKSIDKPIEINRDNKDINLGTLALQEEATGLDEVTIIAEVSTIEQKVDRKVVNIGKDLTTAGATASDIMNNIPSVSVDQQTGNISLRGNENVRVMIDGTLSNVPIAQLLRQIPSTSIKQIELITNPSAKYNPEGMSGLINIILYKNTNIGFNGNINLGLTKEINARFNGSIDMNYRNGKFNLYGNYGNNVGTNASYGNIYRTDNLSNQIFDTDRTGSSHLFKVGLDYYLNEANTISFFTNQNIFDGKTDSTTDVEYENRPTESQLFNNTIDNISSQYNLAYKHNFKKEGEKLDVEIDYSDFNQEENANFDFVNIAFPPNYEDYVDTNRAQTIVNVDYVNPLSDETKLEAGLEARLYDTEVNYDSSGLSTNPNQDDIIGNGDEFIPTPSTFYDYKRDIYSAYITYGKSLEKWSYQFGVRAETVTVDAVATNFLENASEVNPFENDYFQLYPSAFLTYTPSEKNTYQVSYSRRVDRPGVGQVNPIREWSTPLLSNVGNPELEPQFTNSIEANYIRNFEKGSVTAGVFYRLIEDEINRAVFVDRLDYNKYILTFENFDNTSAYGIELSSNYRPTKWWSFNASFDMYSRQQKGFTERVIAPPGQEPTEDDIITEEVTADNIIWNFRVFNNFKLVKNLDLSLFALYRGEEEGIQFTRKPMYFVNTGIRYSFLEDNRATVSFNYNDIFNTMAFEFEGENPVPSIGGFYWESNTWNINLSYRFGGNKYRALQRKNRDDNEKSGSGGFI
ncbi:outer membrane beta-barrel family protein [Hanstruepera ponticola]|uniref:outer membrane beta-barrel family protein n=1 Tax=Hanstruepera ponticola TaxID=2042995 RepID=UPI000CF181EF|nr:outer membrane beta-barrel family protein [Hanstruepera ponticola]